MRKTLIGCHSMLKNVFFATLFAAAQAVAQEAIADVNQEIAYCKHDHQSSRDQNFIPSLNGIMLIAPGEKMSYCDGIAEKGLGLTKSDMKTISSYLSPYLNKAVTLSTLQEIKRSVVMAYRAIGRPLIVVQTPAQDVTNGRIAILVAESKVGDIAVHGNKHTKTSRIDKTVRLHKGERINADTLVSDLAWLNLNPFRRVDAVYRPGKQLKTTDIDRIVEDRFPASVFVGTDNTGLYQEGYETFYAGVNWGNVFGLDHLFSYQYTSSIDFHKLQAHSFNYIAPLSWRHIFTVFGTYSYIHIPILSANFKSNGTFLQTSGRYAIPLHSHRDFLQEVRAGIDFKRTNNTVEFGGELITNHFVNLLQFVLGYKLTYDKGTYKTYFDVEGFYSPARLLSNMAASLYGTLHPGAHAEYFYGRATLEHQHQLPRCWWAVFKLRGQGATTNLLPSEQMGLGGYSTVRGYKERQINVDDAFLANFEIRSPCIGSACSPWGSLVFLGFIDYAIGCEHKKLPHEKNAYNFLGLGPGIRYSYKTNVFLRGDMALRCIREPHDRHEWIRFHFGATANY